MRASTGKGHSIRIVDCSQSGLSSRSASASRSRFSTSLAGAHVEVLGDDRQTVDHCCLRADDEVDDFVPLEHPKELCEIRLGHALALRPPTPLDLARCALAVGEALGERASDVGSGRDRDRPRSPM
jgi:hypothetical protein